MSRAWTAGLLALLLVADLPASRAAEPGRVTVEGDRAVIVHAEGRETLTLAFADEFDRFDRFDGRTGFWRTHYWFVTPDTFGGRSMNNEQQIYVDPDFKGSGDEPLGLSPFSIQDGMLLITAQPTPPKVRRTLHNFRYISGLINTKDILEPTYGYFEMRARLPSGQGLWPAFWLAPADKTWPPEIDILEMLGHDPTTYYVTTHTGQTGEHKTVGLAIKTPDLSKDFHTWGMAWSPKTIRFYFDGQEVAATPTPKDLNKPMYVLANLAVGGNWPGPVNRSTRFPAVMTIDYIRIYQFDRPEAR